jgi:putative transposase
LIGLGTINTELKTKLRIEYGREQELSEVVLNSQSVKTTETLGMCGYGADKKVKGKTPLLLVDIIGLLLIVVVHTMNIQDRD